MTHYTVRISFTLNLETAVDKTIPPQGPFGSFSGAFDCIAQFSSADGVLIPFDCIIPVMRSKAPWQLLNGL